MYTVYLKLQGLISLEPKLATAIGLLTKVVDFEFCITFIWFDLQLLSLMFAIKIWNLKLKIPFIINYIFNIAKFMSNFFCNGFVIIKLLIKNDNDNFSHFLCSNQATRRCINAVMMNLKVSLFKSYKLNLN